MSKETLPITTAGPDARQVNYDELMAKLAPNSTPTDNLHMQENDEVPFKGTYLDRQTDPDINKKGVSPTDSLLNTATGKPIRQPIEDQLARVPDATKAESDKLAQDMRDAGNGPVNAPHMPGEPMPPRPQDLIKLDPDPADAEIAPEEDPASDSNGNGNGNGGDGTPPESGNSESPEENPDENNETLPSTREELEAALDLAQERYAIKTAKSRKSYLGRFAKSNPNEANKTNRMGRLKNRVSKFLKGIPGAQKAIDATNDRFDQETIKARDDYKKISERLGIQVAEQMREVGFTEDAIKYYGLVGNIEQDRILEEKIAKRRQEFSKDSNKFVNWWMNNNGITGKLKKAAVVAGAGLAAGTIGATLAPLIGLASAGAAGAAVAVHVNRRKANAKIKTRDGTTTYSQAQSIKDHTAKATAYKKHHVKGATVANLDPGSEFASVDTSIDATEKRTDAEMLDNRKRVRRAIAVGKIASGAGLGSIRNFVSDTINNGVDMPDIGIPHIGGGEGDAGGLAKSVVNADGGIPKGNPITPRVIDSGPDINTIDIDTIDTLGSFNVEAGNGITQEIVDLAQANGIKDISPGRALEIYNKGVEQFGADNLINSSTYKLPTGRMGISEPGVSSWNPDFAKMLIDELNLDLEPVT